MHKKLFYSHQFITLPNTKGISQFGVSEYVLKHFIRFNKINHQNFPKTNYAIVNKFTIDLFLK
jgi:hypothetical protein